MWDGERRVRGGKGTESGIGKDKREVQKIRKLNRNRYQ